MKTGSVACDTVRKGKPETTLALHELLRRIENEYSEMPGMSVTALQAQRLWGLDSTTCDFVLMTLVERRILRRTPRGTYVRTVDCNTAIER
ncbi:MAG TPA: hypothetical protein VJ691_16945 [Vicinamibacterales bacterium]|nr:hypothetical protein [Vicinamibacterales bacterium]